MVRWVCARRFDRRRGRGRSAERPFRAQADDVAVGRAVHRFGRRLCRQCRLHATGRLPHRGRRGHRRGVDRFADVYFRGRRGALARDTRVALPAGHHGRVPGGLPRELPDTQIGRNGRLRLPVDAEDMGYGVVARHVRCRNAACVALLHRYILHSRKPPLARAARPRRACACRFAAYLPFVGSRRRGDRCRSRHGFRFVEVRMARAVRAGYPQGGRHRRFHRHPGAVHGRERRAVLRARRSSKMQGCRAAIRSSRRCSWVWSTC